METKSTHSCLALKSCIHGRLEKIPLKPLSHTEQECSGAPFPVSHRSEYDHPWSPAAIILPGANDLVDSCSQCRGFARRGKQCFEIWVSCNGGTRQLSFIWIGFYIINHHLGYPHLWKPQLHVPYVTVFFESDISTNSDLHAGCRMCWMWYGISMDFSGFPCKKMH